jgi:hypothetical protein
MSDFQQYKIKPGQFLVMACNILHKTLLLSPRTDSKKIFNAIVEGKRIPLIDVRIEEDSDVRFELSLDQSEYRGERLNYRGFRESISGLVASLSDNLQGGKDIPVFTEQTDGSRLFGIPGVTRDDGQINILMLGVHTGAGTVQLKLQYIDPDQFDIQEQEAG